MKTTIIGVIILSAVLLVACGNLKKKETKTNSSQTTLWQLTEDEQQTGKRLIRVKNMSKETLSEVINNFITTYSQDGQTVERPKIEEKDGFLLTLPEGLNYDLFCFWVNYLVYSDEALKHNDDVVGWYELPEKAQGVWKTVAGEALMMFIPPTDTEYDNVFVVTEDGRCFKQEFAGSAPLVPQEQAMRAYEPMP